MFFRQYKKGNNSKKIIIFFQKKNQDNLKNKPLYAQNQIKNSMNQPEIV
jgi:hypothetical protein